MSDTFSTYRNYLFSIAYRMTGSVMDAEDLVQEAFLRWQGVDKTAVSHPKSFLATIITRLSIDHLRSAQVQRESYVGPWLPEPVVSAELGSEGSAMMQESLSYAFLRLLESLSPLERAVFLLREVFEYAYDEIAEMVDKREANCRQIVRRARQHLENGRTRFSVQPQASAQVATEFMQACLTGNMTQVMTLLAEDVVEWSDGGGLVFAAQKPVIGAEKVARFLLNIVKPVVNDLVLQPIVINGQVGCLAYHKGQIMSAIVLDVRDGRIHTIYSIVNPEKLRHLPPLP
jgi:RNA polymerase sigma-70 factor (ECF subfamily)